MPTLAWVVAHARASQLARPFKGYSLLRTEYTYRILADDPAQHSQSSRVTILALYPGLSVFEGKYQWSGRGGEAAPAIVSPGHRLIGPPISESNWKYYYVHLGRQLAVGQQVTIEVDQQLRDTENRFEPFLAKVVTEPIGSLMPRVILPPGQRPRAVWRIVERGSSVHSRTKGECNADTGEISWEIPHPAVGSMYEIRWET